MMDECRTFHAKILLFGEYTILLGSQAVTLPLKIFSGKFSFSKNQEDPSFVQKSKNVLNSIRDYLKDLNDSGKLNHVLDLNRFDEDLKNGLFFDSDIPQHYGTGSSGALCAAIYDRYARKLIEYPINLHTEKIIEFHHDLQMIENYFHGTSSGIDPLTIYLEHPLYQDNNAEKSIVPIREIFLSKQGLFLVDSKISGNTNELIKEFNEKITNTHYHNLITNFMIPLLNRCINALLTNKINGLYYYINDLSMIQLHYFNFLIPELIREIWEEGLNKQLFTLKLCGSGGGGFFLGFSKNIEDTSAYFKSRNLDIFKI